MTKVFVLVSRPGDQGLEFFKGLDNKSALPKACSLGSRPKGFHEEIV